MKGILHFRFLPFHSAGFPRSTSRIFLLTDEWVLLLYRRDIITLAPLALGFDDEFKVVFNNELCNCPICGEGVIKIWEKCYACSNKDFTVWKNQNGATNLNFKDVLKLCSDGETRTLNFKSKDNKLYKGKLVINDEKQIVTIA